MRSDRDGLSAVNISKGTQEQDLQGLFLNFVGRVARISVGRGRETGRSQEYPLDKVARRGCIGPDPLIQRLVSSNEKR